MAVKIGHASIDENGKIVGGKAGDQTAKEICTRNWYSGGWTVLLRPKSSSVAEKMAKFCEAVCANSKIGYDQSQRNTLRAKAKVAKWNAAKITEACETDCSAFMTVCAEAAGVNVSGCYTSGNAPTTSNMRSKFKATGAFEVLTAKKYLTGATYLKRGDILVKEPGHTIMVLSNGTKVTADTSSSKAEETPNKTKIATGTAQSLSKPLAGTYKTTGSLNVRNNASKNATILVTIPENTEVKNFGYYTEYDGTKWLYIQFNYKGVLYTGFASSKYLKKQGG